MKPQFLLYFFLVLLTIYSDSPLQLVLDTFGASFVPIVSIMLCLVAYPLGLVRRNDVYIKKFGSLIIYTLVISILALVLYMVDDKLTIRGEFLPVKMIKVLLYFVGYLCFLLLIYNLAYSLSVKKMLQPFLVVFFLLTAILVVELMQIPDAFPMLHFRNPTPYWRPRLLSPESSYTASQIQVFGIVSFYYSAYIKKSKLLVLLVSACLLLHIISTGSKTLLLSIFFLVLIFSYNKMKHSTIFVKLFTFVVSVSIIILLCLLVLPQLMESFTTDLEETTSTVTRTYTMICAYGIGTLYPFGTGFQTYMDLLPYFMKQYIWILDYIFDTSNLREILDLSGGDDGKNLSAKSFLAQSSIYWGIIGSVYFVHILIKRFKLAERVVKKDGFWLMKGLFYILLLEIALSSDLSYDILAFIALILVMSNNKKMKDVKLGR